MLYDYETDKLTGIASHYLEIGRYKEALEQIEEILSIKPNAGRILYIRSQCLFYLERYEEAVDACKDAIYNGHILWECNFLLGKIAIESEQYIEAEGYLLESLSEVSDKPEILATYAYLLLIRGYDDEADKALKEALRIGAENPTVRHYHFFFTLVRCGKKKQIEILKEYMKVSSNVLGNYMKIGSMEIMSGNYEKAHENLKQAFLLTPTNKAVLEVLEELEEQSKVVFLPSRFISKIGGPAILWIMTSLTIIILLFLKLYKVAVVIASIYLILALYTLITHGSSFLLKKRGKK